MSKTIDLQDARKPVATAGTYTVLHTADNGAVVPIELNGGEVITTTCPQCGHAYTMPLLDFCRCAGDGDFELFGTMTFCPECSAQKNGR